MTVVTRFAPSPTGFLHIGGARTALFNRLYAHRHGGRFLLRIEDTDKKRSTPQAIDAILNGLDWMGISPDEAPVFQSHNQKRHKDVAHHLLEMGKAYYCYLLPEELTQKREAAAAKGEVYRYDRFWRNKGPEDAPSGVVPAIRIKAPLEGALVIEDLVQGRVEVQAAELDDMILLRADGTPTYNFAVVVDDHDMKITHIIRGDDHLNNAFRQALIFRALGWPLPSFAHIPLIHGEDGKKLSKRKGAAAVGDYKAMGYLPEALRNYLLRLGWSHGDDEIFSDDQARQLFDLSQVNRAPARFDFAKLNHINAHYLRQRPLAELLDLLEYFLPEQGLNLNSEERRTWLEQGLPDLTERASTLKDLAVLSRFYLADLPLPLDEACRTLLTRPDTAGHLQDLRATLEATEPWNQVSIQSAIKALAKEKSLKAGAFFQPFRAALTGSMQSPPLGQLAEILGKTESLRRLDFSLSEE